MRNKVITAAELQGDRNTFGSRKGRDAGPFRGELGSCPEVVERDK